MTLTLLGLSHFAVDFTCAYLVASIADTNIVIALIFYNFCAFALQMPLGIIVEKTFPPLKTASVGIALTVVAWLFFDIPLIALIVAGVGNALFHLGGGISIMNKSEKAAPLGTFIAPGAFGIYFGAFFGGEWRAIVLTAMSALAVILWLLREQKNIDFTMQKTIPHKNTVLLSLFVVVALRGLLGVIEAFPWKSEWSLAFVAAVVFGKVAGGFLADKFGAFNVGAVSLAVSALCFFASDNLFIGLLGIFAFQVTMPVTLWTVSKVTAKGFGFGLLTFALFVGSLPTFLGMSFTVPLPILAIVSLVVLIFGMKRGEF